MTVRISRPCYDKMHRCPGWAGGGNHYAKAVRCDGGYLNCYRDPRGRWWQWKTNRCPKCGLLVLPYMIRYVDPTNWRSEIQMAGWRIRQWFEIRQHRRERHRWRQEQEIRRRNDNAQ